VKSLKWEAFGTRNLFPHISNMNAYVRHDTVSAEGESYMGPSQHARAIYSQHSAPSMFASVYTNLGSQTTACTHLDDGDCEL